MRKAHGKRSLTSFSGEPRSCFFFRHKKDETREVLGVVLDALGKNHCTIMLSRAASRDGGTGFVTAGNGFSHTAGGVLGRHTLPLRMRAKKVLTLCQRHRVRGH